MYARPLSHLLRRLRLDQSGTFAILAAILLPVLLGATGLGAEVTLWLSKNRSLQATADSSAVSAATAYNLARDSDGVDIQAASVAASYGYTRNENGVELTVNRPPLSGKYMNLQTAVEIIIQEPQPRLFSAMWMSGEQLIVARAVAYGTGGLGCVVSLHPTSSGAITAQGNASAVFKGCSLHNNSSNSGCALRVGGSASITAQSVNVVGEACGEEKITATDGIITGSVPTDDPYADRQYDPISGGCQGSPNGNKYKDTVTLDPGRYCKGFSLNAGANVTLNPGVYYMDRGSFSISGGATLSGNGVTIVFTSSTGNQYADATINGGATVDITAPTTGPTAGIAFFGDRNMPEGTSFTFNGGAALDIQGAIYLPKADVKYTGGADTSTGCTQLVASTITFAGNSVFELNCAGFGTNTIGTQTAKLVE